MNNRKVAFGSRVRVAPACGADEIAVADLPAHMGLSALLLACLSSLRWLALALDRCLTGRGLHLYPGLELMR